MAKYTLDPRPNGFGVRHKIMGEIEGYMSHEEGKVIATVTVDKDYCEIGTYQGYSAYMAHKAHSLVLIDTKPNDLFYKHIFPKIRGKTTMIHSHAHRAAQYLTTDIFDVLLIDGRHYKPDVERDFKLYFPKVRNGGLILFHDYSKNYPDVVEFVDGLDLPLCGQQHSLIWFEVVK